MSEEHYLPAALGKFEGYEPNPVTLPPGLAMLAMSPVSVGQQVTDTMGMSRGRLLSRFGRWRTPREDDVHL